MYQFNCNTLLLSRSKNINGMIITVKEFPDETEKKSTFCYNQKLHQFKQNIINISTNISLSFLKVWFMFKSLPNLRSCLDSVFCLGTRNE